MGINKIILELPLQERRLTLSKRGCLGIRKEYLRIFKKYDFVEIQILMSNETGSPFSGFNIYPSDKYGFEISTKSDIYLKKQAIIDYNIPVPSKFKATVLYDENKKINYLNLKLIEDV